MANKKINQLDSRVLSATDLMLVGDPITGTSYKSLVSGLGLVYVPYTGATANVALGEYGISGGYFQADLTPTLTGGVGRLIWNDTDGTMDLGLKGGNVTLHIGQNQYARVVNGTGGDVTKVAYRAVKVTGAQGQRLQVNLAQANNDANSTDTLGVIAEDIANNQTGFICTSGQITGINTTGALQGETWNDGDILYLSPTTPGVLTKVKPDAPNHSVIMGFVVYAHANNGKIFLKVDNGYESSELHDIYTPTKNNNDGIFWVTANNRYESKSVAGALGYTPVPTTRTLTINGTAYDLSADRSWSVGTVTSLTLATGTTGTDVNVSNGTITSSGTITLNIPDASATARGLITTGTQTVAGAKTFSSAVTSTNFVLSGGTGNTGLYYGHTNKVVLANYVVGGGIDFETNGGVINMVLDASGNLDVVGNVTGASIIKSGGTSSQFLKADGSVDSTTYQSALTLTTTGTSGAATLVGSTLNIPQYSGTNIYNGDGTLTGNRSLTHGGYNLSFIGSSFTNRFTSAGRLLLGTTTESTYIFDAVGAARVSGDLAITRQAGGGGGSSVQNYFPSATGTDGLSYGVGKSETAGNSAFFGWRNNSGSPHTFLETYAGTGELRIQNVNASGTIKIGETNQTVSITGTNTLTLTGKYFSITDAASSVTFKNYSSGLSGTEAISYGVGKSETSGNTGFFGWANNSGTPFVYLESYGGGSPVCLQRGGGNVLVGTTSDISSSVFTIASTTKGFLPPRMTTTQKNAIGSPAAGLVVYDTDTNKLCCYNGTSWNDLF